MCEKSEKTLAYYDIQREKQLTDSVIDLKINTWSMRRRWVYKEVPHESALSGVYKYQIDAERIRVFFLNDRTQCERIKIKVNLHSSRHHLS